MHQLTLLSFLRLSIRKHGTGTYIHVIAMYRLCIELLSKMYQMMTT